MPRQNFSKIDSLPEKDLKQIQSLTKNGYSFKYIFEWLETKGYKIAEKTVQNWHKKYLESIASDDNPTAKKALSAIEKQERDTTANPLIDNPKDLEKIAKVYGIPKSINTLDTNPESIIGASQKMISDLFLSTGILCKNRLNLYQNGQAKFPIEQIKALKLLYEMFSTLLGVNELVSPNAAVKSLESYGYNVSDLELQNNSINVNKNENTVKSEK